MKLSRTIGIGTLLLASASVVHADERTDRQISEPVGVQDRPALVVDVGGNAFHFFVSDDGSAGVVEFGRDGSGSILSQLPADVTAYEVFHAVSEPGALAPDGLLTDADAGDALSVSAERRSVLSRPQGWLAELNQQPMTLAAPIQCDSNHNFWATFCVENPPGDTTYTQYECSYDNTGTFAYTVYATNFSGGFCKNSGSNPYSVLRWRSFDPAACSLTGSWTYIWNTTSWSWAAWTWNGANRSWYLYKGPSGATDVGLKWKPLGCS